MIDMKDLDEAFNTFSIKIIIKMAQNKFNLS